MKNKDTRQYMIRCEKRCKIDVVVDADDEAEAERKFDAGEWREENEIDCIEIEKAGEWIEVTNE